MSIFLIAITAQAGAGLLVVGWVKLREKAECQASFMFGVVDALHLEGSKENQVAHSQASVWKGVSTK